MLRKSWQVYSILLGSIFIFFPNPNPTLEPSRSSCVRRIREKSPPQTILNILNSIFKDPQTYPGRKSGHLCLTVWNNPRR